MLQPEQSPRQAASFGTSGRRSLPRASHACQWCRAKKAKCNQQQPCSNCSKHFVDCEYGVRRQGGRKKSNPTKEQAQRGTIGRDSDLSSPAFMITGRHRPNQSELLGQPQQSASSGKRHAPQTLSVDGLDIVGDVNKRTHGTEFYGTSSNFVLLNQLSAFARQHHTPRYVNSNGRGSPSCIFSASIGDNDEFTTSSGNSLSIADEYDTRSGLIALSQDRVSIIDLLSNEEMLSPPSRPRTPLGVMNDQKIDAGDPVITHSRALDGLPESTELRSPIVVPQITQSERTANLANTARNFTTLSNRGVTELSTQTSKRRLEQVYIHVFLDNLHHLHPMLDPVSFEARCKRDVCGTHTNIEKHKRFRHFFALYNIVVAVGALVAGSNVITSLGPDMQSCIAQLAQSENSEQVVSSQMISRIYFRKSKNLLGDTSESCSMESAQTLLLMSLYCQNSHMPHPCYMYCGQAVRTALAIGLANESMSTSAEDRRAARRTWWCIYSHEIDMSCSAGRRDSLGKPHNYQIPLPLIQDQNDGSPDAPESESKSVAMVNEMVHFAAILRRISKELYYDSKGLTLTEKSVLANELDTLLGNWKSRLPEWLNFGSVSFREADWAAKQNIVLHLRYLNARIMAHRLFLAPSTDQRQVGLSDHVGSCLDAARETIQVLYDAYAHRHYFRTWWYNSTYVTYAGMIVLYVVMLRATAVSSEDLLNDVIKAQTILQSMQEATVALRSAQLLREGLQIARSSSQRGAAISIAPGMTDQADDDEPQTLAEGSGLTPNRDHCISQKHFAANGYDHDPGPLFASLLDPGLLQDFTTGTTTLAALDNSAFLFDDLYNDEFGTHSTSTFL